MAAGGSRVIRRMLLACILLTLFLIFAVYRSQITTAAARHSAGRLLLANLPNPSEAEGDMTDHKMKRHEEELKQMGDIVFFDEKIVFFDEKIQEMEFGIVRSPSPQAPHGRFAGDEVPQTRWPW